MIIALFSCQTVSSVICDVRERISTYALSSECRHHRGSGMGRRPDSQVKDNGNGHKTVMLLRDLGRASVSSGEISKL